MFQVKAGSFTINFNQEGKKEEREGGAGGGRMGEVHKQLTKVDEN